MIRRPTFVRGITFFALFAVASATGVNAQTAPVWTDSSGAWRAEVVVLDSGDALGLESVETMRRCARQGLASLALANGSSRIVAATGGDRLYLEASVLEREDGLSATLTYAYRAADGRLVRPVEGVPAEVRSGDALGLCEAIQAALRGARMEH